MKCPQCSHNETKVTDSRLSTDEHSVRRRRECEKCGYRFTTNETREILSKMVLKKNGQKERYSRDKLLRGLRVSLEKRPISFAKINSLCLNIETELMKKKEDEISTKTIGDTVLKHLKEIDEVAYIRFASVYRDFKTIKGFKREISKFLNDDEKN